jgi:hypothetical protein
MPKSAFDIRPVERTFERNSNGGEMNRILINQRLNQKANIMYGQNKFHRKN